MTAELYIIPASFQNNQNLSWSDIEEKIKILAQDFVLIKQYRDTNKIYVNPEIYSVVLAEDAVISDLLFNPEIGKKYIDRDAWIALKKIIVESAETDISVEEIVDVLLPNHNQDVCYGLIAFNTIENIESEYQIVYTKNDWYIFRRYFLGLYPQNGPFFIEECKKYFPNLFFHEGTKQTVTPILKECSRRIIFHLEALNDKYRNSCLPEFGSDQTLILKHFSIAAELDETASLEGNASHKENFTFDFVNGNGLTEYVCCDPHLKLCYNDAYPGDTSYSTNRRIYFHGGKPNIQSGKILVGHIGFHL